MTWTAENFQNEPLGSSVESRNKKLALACGGEGVANHARLHGNQPGATRSWGVFLFRPVGSLELTLGLCYLPPAELLI